MPTYDFLCKNDHLFEDIIPSDMPPPPCVTCGAESKRVPSFRGNVIGDTPKFYPNRG